MNLRIRQNLGLYRYSMISFKGSVIYNIFIPFFAQSGGTRKWNKDKKNRPQKKNARECPVTYRQCQKNCGFREKCKKQK